MFGDANCCNLPKVVHHQRGIIIFGNNQYWIVKPEDEMPNEACSRSLSHSVSLSVELWQMNLQGKIAGRQPEATEASLSLFPSLSQARSLLFLSVFVFISRRTYVHLMVLLLQTSLQCRMVISSVTWLWISGSVLQSSGSSLSVIIASQRKDKIVLLSSDVPSSKNGSTDWFSESSLGKVKTCYCRHVAHLRS